MFKQVPKWFEDALVELAKKEEAAVSDEWLMHVGFVRPNDGYWPFMHKDKILIFKTPTPGIVLTYPEKLNGSGQRRWFIGNADDLQPANPRPKNQHEVLSLLVMLGATYKCPDPDFKSPLSRFCDKCGNPATTICSAHSPFGMCGEDLCSLCHYCRRHA